MSKLGRTIISCLIALFWGLMWYIFIPATNLRSPGFWTFLIFTLICIGAILMFACSEMESKKQDKLFRIAGITVVAVIILFAIGGLISARPFNSGEAQQVAHVTVTEDSFTEAFPDLSAEGMDTLPLVDLDTAKILGDKKIAQLKHASWYDVDEEYNLIKYQDKYYRLSVIDYGGLFKYVRARSSGTPGYVLVDVAPKNGVATQEAKLVELDTGIEYTPGAFWQHDLRRHLRFQYPTKIFDKDSYLEVDEEGTPYWVTGVMKPTAGIFGVKTVTSFIVTNAQTGESQEYTIEELPEWIDHAYSLNYLMTTAYWHYSFGDGFFNNYFSKTNVWRTSYFYRDAESKANDEDSAAGKFANFYGYSSMVDKDGQILFYTGLTAANNANSNIGWLTIDASTGEMVQYDVIGAEESSAQAAVEQLVQDLRYEATFPLPANIGGQPSYVMCLKGKAGLCQGYAICNVENYSIAVQADTLDKAITLYLSKLGVETAKPETDTESVDIETKTATIEAVYSAEIDGTTNFYYVIDGDLYRAAITINQQQVLLEAGSQVEITYYDDGEVFTITKITIVK